MTILKTVCLIAETIKPGEAETMNALIENELKTEAIDEVAAFFAKPENHELAFRFQAAAIVHGLRMMRKILIEPSECAEPEPVKETADKSRSI